MPDEALISQIENLLAEVIALGGENEQSQVVPNLTVQDANPTNLDGWLIVSDDRDGDNILARKVGSVIYSDNDLVNVMFLRGTEPIAFQQGSESSNNGIWEIVPSTSTDIFYDKGDVAIGKSVAPDAAMEILNTAQPQLRLTFQEDTKFADFTLDTNHDLTIKPSSTGQIKLQPTTDSTDFFQVLDADGGVPTINVDSTNERVGFRTTTPQAGVVISNGGALGMEFAPGITAFSLSNINYVASFDRTASYRDMVFDTHGGPTLMLKSSGFVGVNTTGPGSAFEVATSVNAVEIVTINNTSVAGTLVSLILRADNTSNVDGRTWALASNVTAYGDIQIITSNAKAGDPLTAGTARLVIDKNGNAGLNGVTSPSTELDLGAGAIEQEEMTAPAAGAANTTRTYAEDNAGTTRQRVKFSSGNAVTIAEDGGLQTYTPTNVVTDRSYDANATSVAELADVLGTLIADFQAAGVLG